MDITDITWPQRRSKFVGNGIESFREEVKYLHNFIQVEIIECSSLLTVILAKVCSTIGEIIVGKTFNKD